MERLIFSIGEKDAEVIRLSKDAKCMCARELARPEIQMWVFSTIKPEACVWKHDKSGFDFVPQVFFYLIWCLVVMFCKLCTIFFFIAKSKVCTKSKSDWRVEDKRFHVA